MTNEAIDMSRGVPPTDLLPTEKVKECAMSAMDNFGRSLLQYHSKITPTVQGFQPLMELLADEMGNGAKQENVLIGNGSLDVFDILTNSLVEAGDNVLVESPSYDRSITTLERAGCNVTGVPLEEDGLDTGRLADLVEEKNFKLLYIIPDFQNPSGITTSTKKRNEVTELAEEHDFWIIEDSPYYKLRYKGEHKPRMWDLSPQKVLYMSSFSKLIAPGLRIGWTIIPEDINEKVLQYAEDSYITPSILSQGVVYEFLQRGWLEPNIEKLKESYVVRLNALLENLESKMPEASWAEPEGGFFVGLNLPGGTTFTDLEEKSEELGLNFSDSRKFFPEGGDVNFLRIPFCTLSPEEIEESISRLKEVL
ncbi:PLP-dependent aminotransferase family protein [Candidatus Bipolaricaulota bacterium]|nr:PLP-dependent aminotransferase family protein [Candidatus Bipolaricaulota bacterium]